MRLYKSKEIQDLLTDYHGRDPNSMMHELQKSITDAGSLLDPGRWGIGDRKD